MCLTVPRGSPHGRCVRWQWSTAGSEWWMCWLWVVLSSSADILDTSRENHSGETDTVTIIYLYLCVPPALHYTHSVGNSSRTRCKRTGALRFTLHTLTSKPLPSSFKSDRDGFEFKNLCPVYRTNSIHISDLKRNFNFIIVLSCPTSNKP